MDADAARLLTERIYIRLSNRRPDIEKAENYYEGNQPLSFATEEWKKANLVVYPDFAAIPKINRYLEGEDGYRMVASHMPSKYSDKNVVEASERLRKEQRKGNDLIEELIDVVKEKRGRGARYY